VYDGYEPGDFFGELALLNSAPRSASVQAIGATSCLKMDREQFAEVVRGAQTTCLLHGAPKNHDHYGLSIFCMDKRE
jgi:CRP-like cAMP-binding protein